MKRPRYFEWIAGDDIGEIVTLESIENVDGEIIYNFDNDDSCNQRFISKVTGSEFDLKDKFMVEINSPSNPWTVEEEKPRIYSDRSMSENVEIPSLKDIVTNGQGGSGSNIILVPPKMRQKLIDLPTIEEYGIKSESSLTYESVKGEGSAASPVSDVPENASVIKEDVSESKPSESELESNSKREEPSDETSKGGFDPISILVSGCKKHPTDVSMTLTVNLPSKTIYAIADSEFENGSDKFIECVVKGIEIDAIIDAFKVALKSSYSQME